jgi:hypothetical protein
VVNDDPPPFPTSLCHRCRWLRLAGNKRGSVFLKCTEPSLPKYGPQPVVTCAKFEELEEPPA